MSPIVLRPDGHTIDLPAGESDVISHSVRLKRNLLSLAAALRSRVCPPRLKTSIRILLYHSVDNDLPNDAYGMNVTPDHFRRQMQFLRNAPHIEVVDLRDMWKLPDGSTQTYVIVTFDDGFRNNLYRAAPVLVDYGFPFTVFVSVGHVYSEDARFLNAAELRQLSELPGAFIGSHGITHRPLTHLPLKSLTEELVDSKTSLERISGREISAISYPHGKCNNRVKIAARHAGYDLGAASRFGTNRPGADRLFLHRTEIWGTDTVDDIDRKISGHWDWYALYQRLRGL